MAEMRKRKAPVSCRSLGQNAVLMAEARGEQADWFELIEKQNYSSRRSHRVPLLPAWNRKLGLQFTQDQQKAL